MIDTFAVSEDERRTHDEELRRSGHPVAEGHGARRVPADLLGRRGAAALRREAAQRGPAQAQDAADRLLPAEHPHAPRDRGRHAPPRRPRARLQRRQDDPRRRLLPGVDEGHRAHAGVLRRRDRDAPPPPGCAARGRPLGVGAGHQLRRRLGRAPDAGAHRPLHDLEGQGPPRRAAGALRRRHADAHHALDPLRHVAVRHGGDGRVARPSSRCCRSSRPSSTSAA